MTSVSSSLRDSPSSTGIEAIKLDNVPLLLWCVLAVGLLAALDLTLDPLRIVKALGDTDDATRLMQVRGCWRARHGSTQLCRCSARPIPLSRTGRG